MEHKSIYSSYYNPSNSSFKSNVNSFDWTAPAYTELQNEMYQEHKPYSGKTYEIGMRDIFGKEKHDDEKVGEIFFSERNINRLQKQIKKEIYERSRHKYKLEEDQDIADLLVAMRGIYQLHGRFLPDHLVHQVKDLNKKLVNFVIPDMLTQIKQYYGYLKDVNEPIKPIDRPMNVSYAGRKTLPSVSTIWRV
jgi:hypothetical protein